MYPSSNPKSGGGFPVSICPTAVGQSSICQACFNFPFLIIWRSRAKVVNGFPKTFSGSTPGNSGIWSKPEGIVLVMVPVTLLKAAEWGNGK